MTLTAVLLLGAFHGVNPAMGWLFAVARGLQERSRDRLLQSLPMIALGHLASVAMVTVAADVTGSLVGGTALAIGCGVLLVGYGLWRLLSRRHFRWVGMRLSLPQLAGWSFLMSSVHGAGLMLLPVVARSGGHHHGSLGLMIALIHTLAMFVVAGVIAVAVYEFIGLRILRSAWINLDRVWAFALVGAGVFALIPGNTY
ncbi:hypothetical protein [Nonomuraea soli]|uniref:Uncharacterized protein n=1 Tax=Nonomuraea soli TaxID=1032476 RepID=A0A7W0CJ01_9ACTN|nr:hypothetical protein [Nonomuraea soli]